jgi:hypothetical protein
MSGVYLGNWAENGFAAMVSDFTPTTWDYDANAYRVVGEPVIDPALEPSILVAAYTYEDYSGSALVVFEQADGTLAEVNGSHCSCYGLSEADYTGTATSQWQPEPTTAAAILMRRFYVDTDRYYDEPIIYGPIDREIRRVVTEWAEAHGQPTAAPGMV